MRRLLILSCAERKRKDQGLLRAVERYDGPAYRVLRKYLKATLGNSLDLDIFILSAKFGLIYSEQPMPDYDQKMTLRRAEELRSQVLARLQRSFRQKAYDKILILVSKVYRLALPDFCDLIPTDCKMTISGRTQGGKLAELHDWLYETSEKPEKRQDYTRTGIPRSVSKAPVRIRGTEINLTREQVMDVARNALASGQGHPFRFNTWYVVVDGQRVAPKWLVSELTGLSTSAFVSSEARRVLDQLGIQVHCIRSHFGR